MSKINMDLSGIPTQRFTDWTGKGSFQAPKGPNTRIDISGGVVNRDFVGNTYHGQVSVQHQPNPHTSVNVDVGGAVIPKHNVGYNQFGIGIKKFF